MATFLVTPKMSPALARRVQAAVTGRKEKANGAYASLRVMRWLRFGAALGLVCLVSSIFMSLRHEHAMLRQERERLLSEWATQAARLTPSERGFLERVETKIVELANQYPGDFIAEELESEASLSALWARPAVYIRGPLGAFAGSSAVAKTAKESGKDTLLLCLRDPPMAADEISLLEKARIGLLGGGKMYAATGNVLRLYDAEAGLPLLATHFGERIRNAKDHLQLMQLSHEFATAPMTQVERTVRSEILIAVFDEPNDKAGATELDGEAPHTLRLDVLRLDKLTPLIRLRKHIDPSWITPSRRPQYARELDGCRFALDVRAEVALAAEARHQRFVATINAARGHSEGTSQQ